MKNQNVGPQEAAGYLGEIEAAGGKAARLGSAAAGPDARYAVQLGAMIGTLGFVIGMTAYNHFWVMMVGIFGFGVLMQVVVYRHQKSVQAIARGWKSQFGRALGASMALYTLGIVAATTRLVPPMLIIWVPYAVLIAAPLLVLAINRRRSA